MPFILGAALRLPLKKPLRSAFSRKLGPVIISLSGLTDITENRSKGGVVDREEGP